jgi:hypothetical protein
MAGFSRFGSTVYRMMWIVVSYMTICAILLITWSLGFFITFHTYLDAYRDPLQTILGFLFIGSNHLDNTTDIVTMRKISGTAIFLPSQLIFLEILRIVMWLVFVGIIVDAYRKANYHEIGQVTAHEEQIREHIEEIAIRLEKMQKQINIYFEEKTEGEDMASGGKMVVWYDVLRTFEDKLLKEARQMGI